MRYCLYGAGKNAEDFLTYGGLYFGDEITGVFDTDREKWGKYIQGYEIRSPEKIKNSSFDVILVCPNESDEIIDLLMEKYRIPKSKIRELSDLYLDIINRLRLKYGNRQEISDIINSFADGKPNIYGLYRKSEPKKYSVSRDDDEYPYIMLEGKRMYYPKSYRGIYEDCDGNEYIGDALYEQGEGSPHLYIKDDDFADKLNGGVIVDAGVCEGNFALRYIDDAKKIYLIEPDLEWVNALEKTFSSYRNKVVFVKKYLSRSSDRDRITLDDIVDEPVDFLKMDIEGYEIDALLGAKQTLKNSDCHCAICSYHRMNDEENVRFLLEHLGYQTSVSEGYMLFLHDPYFCDTMDFRRGIVYGKKDRS